MMIVVNKLKAKGYEMSEAINIADRIFAEFNPKGMSIEQMVEKVQTKSEYEEEYL